MNDDEPKQLSIQSGWSTWLKTPRGRKLALGIAALVLAVGSASLVTYARYARERSSGGDTGLGSKLSIDFGKRADDTKTAVSLLDGTTVPEPFAKRRPLAVMIENHPDARPQAGLSKASVVIEAIAEGGITRFVALFGSQDAEKIGPIRSARPYFVQFASSWKALYAHAGGSEAGLALIAKSPLVDLQHNQSAFFREARPGIASEHTLFTTSSQLYDYAKQKKASLDADFTPWTFEADPDTVNRGTAQKATIDFSNASYKVEWAYDQASNRYRRSLGGTAHVDASGGAQLTATNVILMTVGRKNDPSANHGKGEWTMDLIGSGKAKILKHGRQTDATWKKSSLDAMIQFTDADGKTVPLGRGTTWLEIVPPDVPVTIE